jgi:hypothetical protein
VNDARVLYIPGSLMLDAEEGRRFFFFLFLLLVGRRRAWSTQTTFRCIIGYDLILNQYIEYNSALTLCKYYKNI